MAEYTTMNTQELNDELSRVKAELERVTARLAEIEALTHPTEPVKGAYKVGRISKLCINAALVTLLALVFFGKNLTGVLLVVFAALALTAFIVGKIETNKGMQRYEADMQAFQAEKKAYEDAQAEVSPLKYDKAVLQQKMRALKEALEKAE